MKIRYHLAAIASVTAIAAATGLAVAAPAGASPVPPSARESVHAGTLNPGLAAVPAFTTGDTYRANDYGGFYLNWNGTFKDELRTTDYASTLKPIASKTVDGDIFYQWQLYGSNNCLEYDGTTTAVIADTCTSNRASQWWWYDPDANVPGYGFFINQFASDIMWAEGIYNGAPVHAVAPGTVEPAGEILWKIYAHSA